MHLIRSGAVGGFDMLANKYGGNAIALIRKLGLSPAQFHNPNTFISLSKLAELLELCAADCDKRFFGLALAQRQNPGVLGDLLSVISQEASLAQALKSFKRHLYLHATGAKVTTVAQAEEVRLEISFDTTTPLGIEQLLQLGTGHLANLVSVMLDTRVEDISLHLKQRGAGYHQGKEPSVYRIHFASSFDGVLLKAATLKQKPRVSEAVLQEHFREYINHLRQRYPGNLCGQVSDIIGCLLPSGDCTIERVAASLGLRQRALQRRLEKDGTSYRDQLRMTRQTIAEQHLRHGSVSVTDLALNLGYADVAAFSRHFKHWTGYSPRQWQQNKRR